MIVADTSVIVAAFSSWHVRHGDAVEIVRGIRDVVAHTALECISVLTRLPDPLRAPSALVADFLERQFTGAWLVLPAAEHAALPRFLAEHGTSGGAVYDALIGRTAAVAGARLVSFDARARDVYARCGVDAELR